MEIEQMLNQLETLGKRKSPRIMWEAVLYYYGAIMLNKYSFRKSIGSKQAIRYYSIIFGSSGIGKSFILNQVEKMCHLEQYAEAMNATYNNMLRDLPEQPPAADVNEILRYMPKSVTIGIEGTSEGLFYVAQSQSASDFGSLNLQTDEFGESITSSSALLSKLKELYDTSFKAKIVKGDIATEMKADISNVICNFIGLGSRKSITAESEKELKRITSSGMFRRTFIIDSKEPVEKNKLETNIKQLEEYIDALNENFKADYLARKNLANYIERFFEYEKGYEEYLDEIDDDLIQKARDNTLDEFSQYNTGALEMVIDLSHIIAFLEWDVEVKVSHLKKAYDFMTRTRNSVEDTFKTVHPYKLMYDLLNLKKNMTISEMAEYEHTIPISKTKVADNIALLEELCYRNDEVLIHNEGKVTRYMIEPLPLNKLDKLIVSITDQEGPWITNFQPLELNWDQLKKLCTSSKAKSFCTAHFSPSATAPDGHRQAPNYIEGANIIAFDIDEKTTIKETQELLSEYKYIIYTSKRHNTEEFNYRDRFRILLPTKNKFYVTPDQYKQLYINIEEFLGLKNNDIQTRNTSRLWFSNPNGTIYENDGELLDVTFLLPNTDKSEIYMPKIDQVNYEMETGELSKREAGFIKYFITNTTQGNRNGNVFNAAKFYQDLGSDNIEGKVIRLNSLLTEPLPDHEINTILRSAGV